MFLYNWFICIFILKFYENTKDVNNTVWFNISLCFLESTDILPQNLRIIV